jgi:putative tricarboxylic transport membrane protein
MARDASADAAKAHPHPHRTSPGGQSRLSVAVGVLILLLGIGTLVASLDLGYWTSLGPGPGFFPFWLGVVLTVLSAVWVAQEVRSGRSDVASPETVGGESPGPLDEQDAPPEYSLPMVLAIVVSLCVLAATLENVGFQVSMLLFLLFHLVVLGRRGWLLSIVIAAAGSFGIFVVFTQVLGVALPASTIPFLRDLGL